MAKRQLAEKATRESEERYRILVDLTPGIIYRIRENRTIKFISQKKVKKKTLWLKDVTDYEDFRRKKRLMT